MKDQVIEIFFNKVLLGKAIMDVNGFYYFYPFNDNGAWSEFGLSYVLNKLKELNKEYNELINKDMKTEQLIENKQHLLDGGFKFTNSITELTLLCYGLSKIAGWHEKPREIGTDLMLIVSEIAEAMEGARKDLNDDHLPHRKMLEVELADALIRILDTAGKYDLDLGSAVVEKLIYNTTRLDHKKENRNKEGGKKF